MLTFSATYERTALCSSTESVAASPVVPQAIIASVPFSIWNSSSLPSSSKLTEPSLFIGVIKATPAPVKIGVLIIYNLQKV